MVDCSGYLKEAFEFALTTFLKRAVAKIRAAYPPAEAALRLAQLQGGALVDNLTT